MLKPNEKGYLKIFLPALAVYLLVVLSASAAPVANIFRNIQPEADFTYYNGQGTTTPLYRWLEIHTRNASTTVISAASGTATTTITSATSTFGNGITLTSGCLLFQGSCLGAGTGITSLNGLTGGTQTFTAVGPLAIVSAGTDHSFNASSSPFFGTLFATGTVRFSNLTTGLALSSSVGVLSNYAGTSCTNQFPRSLDASGAATCATVGTADVSGLDISDDTNLAVTGGLILLNGDTLSGSSSPSFGLVFATSTGTSTIQSGLNVAIARGCLAVNGTCVGGITSLNGLTGSSQTFADNDYVDIVSAGTTHTFSGTTTPTFGYVIATSTSATSTFSNGLEILNGCFRKNGACLTEVPSSLTGILEEAGGVISTVTVSSPLDYTGTTLSCPNCLSTAVANGPLAIVQSTNTYTFNASSSPTFGALYATSSTIKLSGVGSSVALALNGNGFLIASSTLTVQGLTATSTLTIPYATDPTIAVTGRLALNTTSASTSLRIYDGTAERVLNAIRSFVVVIGHEGQSGTSTKILMNHERPLTLTRIFCKTSAVGTTTMVFSDGSNDTEYILCHRLGATDDGSIANGSFISREDLQLRIGSILGSPATTTITTSVREDAD